MHFLRLSASYVTRFLLLFVLYLAVVIGAVTLFLIVTPLFGYLPYSDRPGPGWFGTFPALGWRAFWVHTQRMLGYGLVFIQPFTSAAAYYAMAVLLFERLCHRSGVVRIVGGVVGGLIAGCWMLIIGWYIAAGSGFVLFSILLGASAGATLVSVGPIGFLGGSQRPPPKGGGLVGTGRKSTDPEDSLA